jgi:3-deoxy-7-phosphoheptulonate synthase
MVENNKYINLQPPQSLQVKYPRSAEVAHRIKQFRQEIADIICKKDKRRIIICGPCSIDNKDAAIEYAKRLKSLSKKCPKLLLVMRCYFEKGRTALGWKGWLNDPDKNHTCNIEKGIDNCRELLSQISQLNLPIATEFISPYLHAYFSDFISWGCIGARTTESQPHRELASSLAMPTGFKNSTRGNIEAALNAIKVANHPQTITTSNNEGRMCILHSTGNPYSHLVLRGGYWTNNYNKLVLTQVSNRISKMNINTNIIIDCSHNNSCKIAANQIKVVREITPELNKTHSIVAGIMLESYIHSGNQKMSDGYKPGLSITDECLSWEQTESILLELNSNL